MSKPKNKKSKSKYKQPDALHEALEIPSYEKKEAKDGTEKCPKCKKMEKDCEC